MVKVEKYRRYKWQLAAIGLLVVLNLWWLPIAGDWDLRGTTKSKNIGRFLELSTFQHPMVPTAKKDKIPDLQAKSYILIDAQSNKVLAGGEIKAKIFPASTTKLATALTALNIYPLDEVIEIKNEYKEGKVMELQPGEKITVKSLVTALLVYSANDAAFNLAAHQQDGVGGFVKQMNMIAEKYHLSGTHFVNFDGIHNEDHYSNVYDLSQLARLAIKNPIIKETAKIKEMTVTDVSGTIKHQLTTTDELLGKVKEVEGLKTGWTPEAGGCFVGLLNIDGHELISVVAQSDDRFADTSKIVDWAKANVEWKSYP